MGDLYSEYSEKDVVDSALGFWGGLYPGIRSAVLLWLFLIGIAVLNSFTAGTSVVFCYPVQLFLYVANGSLAGYFALGSGYHTSDLPRVGAIGGFVAWILPTLFYLVFGFILGVVTLGIGFLGIAVWALCGPIDLAIQATCGALGAWLYGRFAGEQESDWYE
ncbi:MAG: hypothetical protein H8D43_03310 [Chloroflexi bacterium]|nr:hypothetical protein [Chloroflexota bacterium]